MRINPIFSVVILAAWWVFAPAQAWAGLVFGPTARAQFEGFVASAGDTFIDFESLALGTNLSNQLSGLGVTFSSNIDTNGNPFGPINVYVSNAPQCTGQCIVGTPSPGATDDGRIGYQIVFSTPQRRAGLMRRWNTQTDTRFYNQSDQLLAGHVNTVNNEFVGFIADGADSATQWVKRIQIDTVAPSTSRQVGYSDDLFFGTAQAFTANLASGFNLIGNALNAPLDVAATFGNQDLVAQVTGVTPNVVSIWKWNAVEARWAFNSPQLTSVANIAYAAAHNYEMLATINPGDGYWVNASTQMTLPVQTGTGFNWNAFSFSALPSGFNLIATADSLTPSQFNTQVSQVPPTGSFVSLWAWDAVARTWYFYSPLLVDLAAVKSYANSRGFLHFEDFDKTLGIGTGFWVNKP